MWHAPQQHGACNVLPACWFLMTPERSVRSSPDKSLLIMRHRSFTQLWIMPSGKIECSAPEHAGLPTWHSAPPMHPTGSRL